VGICVGEEKEQDTVIVLGLVLALKSKSLAWHSISELDLPAVVFTNHSRN